MKSRYGTLRQKSHHIHDHDEFIIYSTVVLEAEAKFAMQIIERWPGVQGTPDHEIVNRACEIAEKTFEEFKKRGWLFPVPPPEKIKGWER
jgi:hypothetical protein